MRLDELPRSDNIEDRRGETGSAGSRYSRWSRRTWHWHNRGSGPHRLGTRHRPAPADRRRRNGFSGGGQFLPTAGRARSEWSNRRAVGPSRPAGVRRCSAARRSQWKQIFAQSGRSYEAPTLVMFSGATRSACGFAQAAMGPFYCPNDRKVYLDTSFFQDLENRFRACDVGSKTCQFSQAYVIAHEVGHHVQNLLGILPKAQSTAARGWTRSRPIRLQVRVELQADCLAGDMGEPRAADLGLHRARRRRVSVADSICHRRRPAAEAERRATSYPTPSPTAPRNSAPNGSPRASSQAHCRVAIPLRPRSNYLAPGTKQ